MHDINLFSSPPLPPISHTFNFIQPYTHLPTPFSSHIHLTSNHTLIYSLPFILESALLCFYIYVWSHSLQPSSCEHLTNYALSFLFLISLHFLLIPLSASPFPSFSFQSPSIWASESGRAPDPPMRLGCEGAEPPRPGRGGASIA